MTTTLKADNLSLELGDHTSQLGHLTLQLGNITLKRCDPTLELGDLAQDPRLGDLTMNI